MYWYLKCLNQYADFKGRASRKEYWMFVLFNIIIGLAFSLFEGAIGLNNSELGIGFLSGIYSLGVLIPGLAVCVRRLHDIGKSGWYYFLILIPIIGAIILLVFLLTEGENGVNKWGDDPKTADRNS